MGLDADNHHVELLITEIEKSKSAFQLQDYILGSRSRIKQSGEFSAPICCMAVYSVHDHMAPSAKCVGDLHSDATAFNNLMILNTY